MKRNLAQYSTMMSKVMKLCLWANIATVFLAHSDSFFAVGADCDDTDNQELVQKQVRVSVQDTTSALSIQPADAVCLQGNQSECIKYDECGWDEDWGCLWKCELAPQQECTEDDTEGQCSWDGKACIQVHEVRDEDDGEVLAEEDGNFEHVDHKGNVGILNNGGETLLEYDATGKHEESEFNGEGHSSIANLTVQRSLAPCTKQGNCFQSPNYPSWYNDNEQCSFSMSGTVTSVDFNTERYYDILTVGTTRASGTQAPVSVGDTFNSESVLWKSDHSYVKKPGWKICLSGAQSCQGCSSQEYKTGTCPNVQCNPCRSCGYGQWRSGCGGTSAGTCQNCQTCGSGQYRSGCSGQSSAGRCLTCQWCPTNQWRKGCAGMSPGSCQTCTTTGNAKSKGCPNNYMTVSICTDCQACTCTTGLADLCNACQGCVWSNSQCTTCPGNNQADCNQCQGYIWDGGQCKQAMYQEVTTGSCADVGYQIENEDECKIAAHSIGYTPLFAMDTGSSFNLPPFCYYESGFLKLNANGNNGGSCSTLKKCMCKTVQTQVVQTGFGAYAHADPYSIRCPTGSEISTQTDCQAAANAAGYSWGGQDTVSGYHGCWAVDPMLSGTVNTIKWFTGSGESSPSVTWTPFCKNLYALFDFVGAGWCSPQGGDSSSGGMANRVPALKKTQTSIPSCRKSCQDDSLCHAWAGSTSGHPGAPSECVKYYVSVADRDAAASTGWTTMSGNKNKVTRIRNRLGGVTCYLKAPGTKKNKGQSCGANSPCNFGLYCKSGLCDIDTPDTSFTTGSWKYEPNYLLKKESSATTFRCNGGHVVPTFALCNGQKNCGDNTDESGCSSCPSGYQSVNNVCKQTCTVWWSTHSFCQDSQLEKKPGAGNVVDPTDAKCCQMKAWTQQANTNCVSYDIVIHQNINDCKQACSDMGLQTSCKAIAVATANWLSRPGKSTDYRCHLCKKFKTKSSPSGHFDVWWPPGSPKR